MDMVARGSGKRSRRLRLGMIAVALLSFSVARAGEVFVEDDCCMLDECLNCNLYWHGSEGCVTSRLPRWYAGADVLVLRRDMDEEVVFASQLVPGTPAGPGVEAGPPVAGPVALGSNSFKDEFDAGLRVMLGYALNDCYRIEASYFGSYFFSGDMAIRTVPNPAIPGGSGDPPTPDTPETPGFNGLGFPFGDDGNFARIRFSSTLNNVELNLRSRLSECPGPLQVSVLFGGRYMKLDERFLYNADGMAITNVEVETSNDLLGLQIGLMAQWQCHPRSWLDYEIKGGVYTNRASYRSTSGGPMAGPPMSAEKDVTAFSVDMSLMFNWQLTQSTSLRFGYNAMWLGGVALGAHNVQTNTQLLMNGPEKLDHAGFVVYHGPSFGVVFAR